MGTRGIDQQKGGGMNKPICNECGSDEAVYIKLIFYWDEDNSVWGNEPFCTEVHCGICCNEQVELNEEHKKAEVHT